MKVWIPAFAGMTQFPALFMTPLEANLSAPCLPISSLDHYGINTGKTRNDHVLIQWCQGAGWV